MAGWTLVLIVGSCLARGEAWSEQKYEATSKEECFEMLKEARLNSPEINGFCAPTEPKIIVCPVCISNNDRIANLKRGDLNEDGVTDSYDFELFMQFFSPIQNESPAE